MKNTSTISTLPMSQVVMVIALIVLCMNIQAGLMTRLRIICLASNMGFIFTLPVGIVLLTILYIVSGENTDK